MQGLPDRVNMRGDRSSNHRARWSGNTSARPNQPAQAARLLSIGAALAVVVFGDLSRLPHAVIAVGLAVAAADGAEDARTEFRYFCADAGMSKRPHVPGLNWQNSPASHGMGMMPPHCLPRPTAWALVGNESVTTNAAASETKRRVFILASHDALLVRAGNQRLQGWTTIRNDCRPDAEEG
jgi:hypothetical protein